MAILKGATKTWTGTQWVPSIDVITTIDLGVMVAGVPKDFVVTNAAFAGVNQRGCEVIPANALPAGVFSVVGFVSDGSLAQVTVRVVCSLSVDPGDIVVHIRLLPPNVP